MRFSTKKICKSCCGAAFRTCRSSTSSKRHIPGEFLKDLLEFFRSCHDELRTPDDYDAYLTRVERKEIPLPRVGKSKDAEAMADDEVLDRCREIARVFRYVEDLLKQEGLGTFGHIITRAVDLLSRRQSVLQRAQKHARFILIDEFQDSNVAQIKLARLARRGQTRTCFAVGDPDQAIYRFRGATSGAFDQFLKTFGSGRVRRATLSQNRRSTPPILRCAYQTIACNPLIASVNLHEGGWPREPLGCARLESDPVLAQRIGSASRGAQRFRAGSGVRRRHDRGHAPATACDEVVRHSQCCTALIPIGKRCWPNFGCRDIPGTSRESIFSTLRKCATPWRRCRSWKSSDPIALFRVAAFPSSAWTRKNFALALALAGKKASIESLLEKVRAVWRSWTRCARRDTISPTLKRPAGAGDEDCATAYSNCPTRSAAASCRNWPSNGAETQATGRAMGTLREFLDYRRVISRGGRLTCRRWRGGRSGGGAGAQRLRSRPREDAVQLMTVHAAKGLEFPCVFVLRCRFASFPHNYTETLVEFPQQLRSKDNAAESPPKMLHEEQERRLFYVAMTRAMDELYVCGKDRKAKNNPAPTKFMRELVSCGKSTLKGAIECRLLPPADIVPTLQAAAEPLPVIAQWVQLPPRCDAHLDELSASAIEQYERCPLAFKLSRDWCIPKNPRPCMQFGSAMHLALKAYFDGVRAGAPPDEDTVIACFRDEFGKAKIEEDAQRDLYEKDGCEQLRQFLRSDLARPSGEILNNERFFRADIGGTLVKGRMDRLERIDGDRVSIVDYKTGKPKTQDDADESLQLSIYALAARSMGVGRRLTGHRQSRRLQRD